MKNINSPFMNSSRSLYLVKNIKPYKMQLIQYFDYLMEKLSVQKKTSPLPVLLSH